MFTNLQLRFVLILLQVGDGTTSVIILAGEVLAVSEPFLRQQMHPTLIISAYRQALEEAVTILRDQIRHLIFKIF